EQALGIARALTDEQEPFARAFPVPSAGIHPGLVPLLVRDFGLDCIVNAGGGIHGHPDGAIGGGQAFRAAIDAALAGRLLREAAKENEALQKAIDRWGAIEVEA
ncbi:RuBisCO large subunit C-terminal-like domain-containing protein, partial [Geobacillus thermodenitrificans]